MIWWWRCTAFWTVYPSILFTLCTKPAIQTIFVEYMATWNCRNFLVCVGHKFFRTNFTAKCVPCGICHVAAWKIMKLNKSTMNIFHWHLMLLCCLITLFHPFVVHLQYKNLIKISILWQMSRFENEIYIYFMQKKQCCYKKIVKNTNWFDSIQLTYIVCKTQLYCNKKLPVDKWNATLLICHSLVQDCRA